MASETRADQNSQTIFFFHHAPSFQASHMTSLLARKVVSFRALMFISTTMRYEYHDFSLFAKETIGRPTSAVVL